MTTTQPCTKRCVYPSCTWYRACSAPYIAVHCEQPAARPSPVLHPAVLSGGTVDNIDVRDDNKCTPAPRIRPACCASARTERSGGVGADTPTARVHPTDVVGASPSRGSGMRGALACAAPLGRCRRRDRSGRVLLHGRRISARTFCAALSKLTKCPAAQILAV